MKNALIKLIVIILFSLWINSNVLAEEKIKLLPSDLLDVARSYQCDQINAFYDRPGMINPPYAYGYSEGPEEDSAVFWCEKKENNKRLFYLIIHSSPEIKGVQNCPNKIIWSNYPGGLSIYKDFHTTLDDFVYIRDTKKKAPPNLKMTHNAILSEYDGKEELFYCHDGNWMVRQRD
jgi:hypothetical protein